jgi:hypothetical protein
MFYHQMQHRGTGIAVRCRVRPSIYYSFPGLVNNPQKGEQGGWDPTKLV